MKFNVLGFKVFFEVLVFGDYSEVEGVFVADGFGLGIFFEFL